MTLPDDVSRCLGRVEWGDGQECEMRKLCARYLAYRAGLTEINQPSLGLPMIQHCYVDGQPIGFVEVSR